MVSSDGTQTDFSYNKCMDNYVRKNYAEEHAERVCQMYFMKRNRPAAADGGTAPVTPAEASQSTPAETSQAALAQEEAQVEAPAAPAETASQDTPASPSTTQQETPVVATPQETPAAPPPAEAHDKWADEKSSDDKWA